MWRLRSGTSAWGRVGRGFLINVALGSDSTNFTAGVQREGGIIVKEIKVPCVHVAL